MAVAGGRLPGDEDWAALEARRARCGVYGVRSTGIFCRFGCPARRPLRRNVLIFATGQAAAEAGFRPCLRCHPEGCVQSTHPTLDPDRVG